MQRDTFLIDDGGDRLRKFVNLACGVFLLGLIAVFFLHKGSFENIRSVMTANAAVRAKYGNLGGRLTTHGLGIYTNPASNDRLYIYEFWYANHHGTVQEETDGHGFKVLQVKEN